MTQHPNSPCREEHKPYQGGCQIRKPIEGGTSEKSQRKVWRDRTGFVPSRLFKGENENLNVQPPQEVRSFQHFFQGRCAAEKLSKVELGDCSAPRERSSGREESKNLRRTLKAQRISNSRSGHRKNRGIGCVRVPGRGIKKNRQIKRARS